MTGSNENERTAPLRHPGGGPASARLPGGFRPLLLATFLLALLPARPAGTNEGGEPQDATLLRPPDREALRLLDELRGESAIPLEVRWQPASGRLRSLTGRIPLAPGPSSPESRALELLARHRVLFGWHPGVDLHLRSRCRGSGTLHLRFGASLHGIPLAASEAALHLEVPAGAGVGATPLTLLHATSSLHPELPAREALEAAVRAALPPAEAAARALAATGARTPRWVSPPRLELLPLPPPGRLTYAVEILSGAPRGLFLVRLDAASGEVLSTADRLQYGPGAPRDGSGRVFLVSPVVALRDPTLQDQDDGAGAVPLEAYSEVALRELDGSGTLTGPYVTTGVTPRAVRRVRLQFHFLRDDDAFEEVMAYYHIDSVQRYFQSLGFDDVSNRQVPVYANSEPPGVPYLEPQAYYAPDPEAPGTGAIAFGSGGVDFAEDPEVIVHEYGHAVQDNQVPGFGSTFESFETSAVGEGWSDFLAAAYLAAFSGGHGDACLAEWAARGLGELYGVEADCLRRVDSEKHYPEDLLGEPHEDGQIWSGALWELFQALGRDDSLRLVLESHFFLEPAATFFDAARAVLLADQKLFDSRHESLLRGVFSPRGLLVPPPPLAWFYVIRHAPPAPLPAEGAVTRSKIRLDRPGRAGSLQVYVELVHPFPFVLELSLRSPAGTTVALHRAGSRLLPPGPLIFGGNVAASEPLDPLAGEAAAGVWTLAITNNSFDPGQLGGWGLRFGGFVRGDADGTGEIDVADAIATLRFLVGRIDLACAKAADFDDTGTVNVTDAVAILRFLLGLGPPPPEPFPSPGEDLTPDELPCDGSLSRR